MGDIIKIRMFLEKHSELETSMSSTESEDLHVSITSADRMPKEVSFPVETSPKEAMVKKVRFSRLNLFVVVLCSLVLFSQSRLFAL